MLYLSRQAVQYTPQGQAPLQLCDYDDIMTRPVTMQSSVAVQRDDVYRAHWLRQAARGNASIPLTLTVAKAFESRAEAEAYGEDMQEYLLLHPAGIITIWSCYTDTTPGREKEYTATLDKIDCQPITQDNQYGQYLSGKACWATLEYQFTLTNPALLVPATANYTGTPVVEFRERDFYQYTEYPIFSGRLGADMFAAPYRINAINKFSLQALSGITITDEAGTVITQSIAVIQDGTANGRPTYTYQFSKPVRLIQPAETVYMHFPGEQDGRPDYVGRTMGTQALFNFWFMKSATELGRTPMFGEVTATLYT